jgi:hypothetical protein
MKESGDHVDNALLHGFRLRVFCRIDEVLVEAFTSQLLRLIFHPGGDKGSQVALRLAIPP